MLIVNPISGARRHQARIKFVQHYFQRHGHELDLYLTTGPGHARELAAKAAAEGVYSAVIGAGGDGTINEVTNGLAGSDTPLGILPWGTANVFSLEMGFPRTLRQQCRQILHGRIARLDLGYCNDRAFLLMAGIGFDAYSLRNMVDLKQSLGAMAYVVAGLRSFFRYQSPMIRFRTAHGSVHEAAYLLVSNTSRYGAIFSVTPRANPADGHLDLYVFRERGRWRLLKLVLSTFLSLLTPESRIRRRLLYLREGIVRTTKVYLESDHPVYIQLDGDFCDKLPAEISIRPDALRVILPLRAWKHLSKAKPV